jgi:hypothetical protein
MNETYYPEVVQCVPGSGKCVYAYFSDGNIRLYDVSPLIEKGGVFERLNDDEFFRSALTVLNGTVAWDLSGEYDASTCIDIDPFTVYQAKPVADPLESIA